MKIERNKTYYIPTLTAILQANGAAVTETENGYRINTPDGVFQTKLVCEDFSEAVRQSQKMYETKMLQGMIPVREN